MREQLSKKFQELFGEGRPGYYFAPGRVNLIGEHTDYNGGHVFPCALTIGTYGMAAKNHDGVIRVYSMNFEQTGVITIPVGEMVYDKADSWANYVKGVIWSFAESNMVIDSGFDLVICGNIPNSSGLSSSASIEVLTSVVLKDLFGFTPDMVEVSRLTQRAENQFNGVNCGIMDQFSIAMGKKDHAIFLDTADLSYEYAPMKLQDAKIVIACSNKKRGLADSKYNERRSQCEAALAKLQEKVDIKNLGELTEEQFDKLADCITDPVIRRRARHAVYENQRTIRAVAALRQDNIEEFGRLMNASHISLRDDYQVTGIELDTLVEAAWEQPGVIGSRMTGAGFGGCTVSIVKDEAIDDFIKNVGAVYKEKIGYPADFYVVEIGDGGRVL